MNAPDLAAAALDYSARGWPLFPLHTPTSFGPKRGDGRATCSCRGSGCENQGKHPRTTNGLDDATTDTDMVAKWWRQWPTANIGLATGHTFDVLDLDGADALDALDALAPEGAGPIIGPMAVTGCGVHIYGQPTGAGNRTGMGGRKGLDWRGRRGYVVAPPSLHYLHGDRYAWGDLYPLDTELKPAPAWLADLAHNRRPTPPPSAPCEGRSTTYGARALEGEVARLALAADGTRNDELNRAAFNLGQLVASGDLDANTVVGALLTVAHRIGLPETEADLTITSGMSNGMTNPRTGLRR